jgi:hypothetical protein
MQRLGNKMIHTYIHTYTTCIYTQKKLLDARSQLDVETQNLQDALNEAKKAKAEAEEEKKEALRARQQVRVCMHANAYYR